MTLERNPLFLKKKYSDLHASTEVTQAAHRREKITQKKISSDPTALIQNYLDRFREISNRKDPEERTRGIEAIKRLLYRFAVIKPEDIPQSVFLLEQHIARELGHGTIEIKEEFRENKKRQIIADQQRSLDRWVEYLASAEANIYPDWVKYWTMRSVMEMGKFEKQGDPKTGTEVLNFKRRTRDTVSPFPPLNQRALAETIGVLIAKQEQEAKPKEERQAIANRSKRLNNEAFQSLIAGESFSKIYTQFLTEIPEYSQEGLEETRGLWKKYAKGSDPTALVESLDGYPLEWCTANKETAANQLKGGDFYVYYSFDQAGNPIIPRVAIRMEAKGIAEVRGVAANQQIDPYIVAVIEEKMREFPDSKAYANKVTDMKRLTTIEKKVQARNPLDKEELIFLYEINSKIEGFGYWSDPRITELRASRDPEEDMPILFGCDSEQIARSPSEVNEFTKVYIGPLFQNIFKILGHIDHIYTSFPEGKIVRYKVEIGGRSTEKLEEMLQQSGFKISDNAHRMMKNKSFKTHKDPQQADLVCFTSGELFGDVKKHTQREISEKIHELGLELCPAIVGPSLRLHLTQQPMDQWFLIYMRLMASSDDPLRVFKLTHDEEGLWLTDHEQGPFWSTSPLCKLVFRVRR